LTETHPQRHLKQKEITILLELLEVDIRDCKYQMSKMAKEFVKNLAKV
jgi:hypothetical protein